MWRLCGRLLAAAALAAGLSQAFGAAGPRWMGTATCASMSCHHANGPQGSPRSEYTTWAAADKHHRAYQVLYDERSERMVRNLYGRKARHAVREPLCLKCHAMNDGSKANTGERFALADGVGCESCHGPAEKWLTTHYLPGFTGAVGYRDVRDLAVRAKLCVGCHVGGPGREVNHDLIAAGHPRLNFEFSAFLAIYPKHWSVSAERRRHPDLEARVWALGQIESARASLALLEARARTANRGSPWPEFAEYSCFACHKDLRADSPRRKADFGGRRPGSLPWGTWYFSAIGPYARKSATSPVDLAESLAAIRKLMEQPSPDAEAVADQAHDLLPAFDRWLARVNRSPALSPAKVRGLMQTLAGDGARRGGGLDWDEATQLYLGLVPLHQTLEGRTGGRPEVLIHNLYQMRRKLRGAFPPGLDSPQWFNPSQKPALGNLFEDIIRQLGP